MKKEQKKWTFPLLSPSAGPSALLCSHVTQELHSLLYTVFESVPPPRLTHRLASLNPGPVQVPGYVRGRPRALGAAGDLLRPAGYQPPAAVCAAAASCTRLAPVGGCRRGSGDSAKHDSKWYKTERTPSPSLRSPDSRRREVHVHDDGGDDWPSQVGVPGLAGEGVVEVGVVHGRQRQLVAHGAVRQEGPGG